VIIVSVLSPALSRELRDFGGPRRLRVDMERTNLDDNTNVDVGISRDLTSQAHGYFGGLALVWTGCLLR